MTPYAKQLLDYAKANLPQGADAEAWLDKNINPLWRQQVKQPEAREIIVEDCGDEHI